MATTTEPVRKRLVDGDWYETGETLDVTSPFDGSLVAQGSASSTSPTWAAAYASSAIDGGLVLPDPTMSGAKDRDVTRPASKAPPPAASAYKCHLFDVREPSCQKKPHWWIDPQTNR